MTQQQGDLAQQYERIAAALTESTRSLDAFDLALAQIGQDPSSLFGEEASGLLDESRAAEGDPDEFGRTYDATDARQIVTETQERITRRMRNLGVSVGATEARAIQRYVADNLAGELASAPGTFVSRDTSALTGIFSEGAIDLINSGINNQEQILRTYPEAATKERRYIAAINAAVSTGRITQEQADIALMVDEVPRSRVGDPAVQEVLDFSTQIIQRLPQITAQARSTPGNTFFDATSNIIQRESDDDILSGSNVFPVPASHPAAIAQRQNYQQYAENFAPGGDVEEGVRQLLAASGVPTDKRLMTPDQHAATERAIAAITQQVRSDVAQSANIGLLPDQVAASALSEAAMLTQPERFQDTVQQAAGSLAEQQFEEQRQSQIASQRPLSFSQARNLAEDILAGRGRDEVIEMMPRAVDDLARQLQDERNQSIATGRISRPEQIVGNFLRTSTPTGEVEAGTGQRAEVPTGFPSQSDLELSRIWQEQAEQGQAFLNLSPTQQRAFVSQRLPDIGPTEAEVLGNRSEAPFFSLTPRVRAEAAAQERATLGAEVLPALRQQLERDPRTDVSNFINQFISSGASRQPNPQRFGATPPSFAGTTEIAGQTFEFPNFLNRPVVQGGSAGLGLPIYRVNERGEREPITTGALERTPGGQISPINALQRPTTDQPSPFDLSRQVQGMASGDPQMFSFLRSQIGPLQQEFQQQQDTQFERARERAMEMGRSQRTSTPAQRARNIRHFISERFQPQSFDEFLDERSSMLQDMFRQSPAGQQQALRTGGSVIRPVI